MRWEHIAHEADVGVRGFGPTPAAAFEQCALALTAVVTDLGSVREEVTIGVEARAADLELLLIEWLSALVFELSAHRRVFGRFEVEIADQAGFVLRARCHGEPLDVPRHQPAAEVKGATYAELSVARTPAGEWRAQCILDV